MKSPRPLEFAWPEALVTALDEYLADYRPTLLRAVDDHGAVDAVFVSAFGVSFDANRVGERVSKRTGAVFGRSVNAHLFRSIAATTIATETPENIVDAARVLHHGSLRTNRTHYVRARALEAGRALHRAMAAERSKANRKRSNE